MVHYIILSCLTLSDSSKPIQKKRISVNHKGFSTPITYIVVIIVAGKTMHEQEMNYSIEKQKLQRGKSHPVTIPWGENSENPANKQDKNVLKPYQIQ